MKKIFNFFIISLTMIVNVNAQWLTTGNTILTPASGSSSPLGVGDFLGSTNGLPLYMFVYDKTVITNPFPIMTLEQSNVLFGLNNYLQITLPSGSVISGGDNNILTGNYNIYNSLSGNKLIRSHMYGNDNTFINPTSKSTDLSKSFILGNNNTSEEDNNFTIGNSNYNRSNSAFLIGNHNSIESAPNSFAMGDYILLNNPKTFAIGNGYFGYPLLNSITNSLIVGFDGHQTFFVGPENGSTVTGVGVGNTSPVSLFHSSGEVSIGNYSTALPTTNGILNINTSGLGNGNGIIIERNESGWDQTKARINMSTETNGKHGMNFTMTNDAFVSSTNAMHIADDGTVGFGTADPVSQIHSMGRVSIGQYSMLPTYAGALNINTNGPEMANGIVISRTDINNVPPTGSDLIAAKISISSFNGPWGLRFLMSPNGFVSDPNNPQLPSWGYEALFLGSDGNVGIGTTTPYNKLDVKGTIRAYRVRVETGWSDYVFKPDYKLVSLEEVEKYIKQNSHLPEIPSEKEIVENGLDLGHMQNLHMKKIEELTLYIIELKKEVDELKKKVNQQ